MRTHALAGDAENIGGDLCERRLAAFPERGDAAVEVDRSGAVRAQRHALMRAELGASPREEPRARVARALDESAEADAGDPAGSVRRFRRPTVSLVAGGLGRHPERARIVAAVVD